MEDKRVNVEGMKRDADKLAQKELLYWSQLEVEVKNGFNKGKASYYAKVGQKFAEYQIESGEADENKIKWFQEALDFVNAEEEKKASKEKYFWSWVTISPDPAHKNYNLAKILANAKRSFECDWIKQCYWTIEKYTGTGERIHVHALIERKEEGTFPKTPERVKNAWRKKLPANVQISYVPESECSSILKYMRGEKKGYKELNSIDDKAWRQAVGIEDMYYYKNDN